MQRIDGADVAGVLAAPSATVAPGYFTDGDPGTGVPATVITQDWLNTVQEELVAAIVLKGATLSKANLAQLADTLGAIRGVESAAGGAPAQAAVETVHGKAWLASGGVGGCDAGVNAQNAALLASADCTVDGASSATLASDDSTADGAIDSAVVAARYGFASASQALVCASYLAEVTGQGSAIIATGNGFGGFSHNATGLNCAILASGDQTGLSPCQNDGDRSAIVAADACSIDATSSEAFIAAARRCDVDGVTAAIIATLDGITTADQTLIAASSEDGSGVQPETRADASAVIASWGGKAFGSRSAAIGVEDVIANGNGSVVLASHGVELSTGNAVGGGVTAGALGAATGADRNLTWRIESLTGNIYTDGTAGAGAADYAEMFENETVGALPTGALVSRVPGTTRIRLAKTGDRVLGAVSAAPAILGNAAPVEWAGRYKRDDFGAFERKTTPWIDLTYRQPTASSTPWLKLRYRVRDGRAELEALRAAVLAGVKPDTALAPIWRVVKWEGAPARAPAVDPADVLASELGERVEASVVRRNYSGPLAGAPVVDPVDIVKGRHYEVAERVETGAADPGKAYKPRQARADEWTPIGLLGQLAIRVDATVAPDDDVVAGPVAGVGTAAKGKAGKGASVECMKLIAPFDAAKGYAIALCMVR